MRSKRPWRSAPRAAAPLSTAVTVCPRRASTIWASLRLTELSSTSSTASLAVRAGSRAGPATAGAPLRSGAAAATRSASAKRAVKLKVLPLPGALSSHIRPCISSTRRAEMVRPSPVPP